MTSSLISKTIVASVVLILFAPALSHANMSDAEYIAALKTAQQKIERERAANAAHADGNNSNALSSSLLTKLMGRYYRVGDKWEVAAWNFDNAAMRRTDQPEYLTSKPRRGGVFRYEVVDVRTGAEPQAVIQVTQLNAHGLKPVDGKVERLILTMNDRMLQSEKAYQIAGRITRVSPNGIRSSLTPLELYPLDVPELVTAIQLEPEKMPELPPEIARVVGSRKPDLSQSLWFEQDDLFGRPIQALWERGNPWPSYFKTTHGVAVLLRKDES
jgi:hypothetical protein